LADINKLSDEISAQAQEFYPSDRRANNGKEETIKTFTLVDADFFECNPIFVSF
jgi:hypothetical protein